MTNSMQVSLKDFLELTNYRITDISSYGWNCFGEDTSILEYWSGTHTGFSVNCIYSRKSFLVFNIEVCNYRDNTAWRWIDPAFTEAEKSEALRRMVTSGVAWEDEDADGNPFDVLWQEVPLETIREIAVKTINSFSD